MASEKIVMRPCKSTEGVKIQISDTMKMEIAAGIGVRRLAWMKERAKGSCPSLAAESIVLVHANIVTLRVPKHENATAIGIITATFFPNKFSTKVVLTV